MAETTVEVVQVENADTIALNDKKVSVTKLVQQEIVEELTLAMVDQKIAARNNDIASLQKQINILNADVVDLQETRVKIEEALKK